jgi:plastocyanin
MMISKLIFRAVLPIAFWLAASIPLGCTEVSGHIRGPGQTSTQKLTVIVYAEALENATAPKPGHFKMAQQNKTFVPHILAIPVGSKVDFPNADPIFHNVFSQSGPSPFNLGMYRTGQWKTHVFTVPATYHIFCKIHSQMAGVILVLPTSFITHADASGNYQMDLPPGRYRITAWTEVTRPASTEATVSNSPAGIPDLALGQLKVEDLPQSKKE